MKRKYSSLHQRKFMLEFGCLCAFFRKNILHITLRELSIKSGIPVPTLSSFELGRSSNLRFLDVGHLSVLHINAKFFKVNDSISLNPMFIYFNKLASLYFLIESCFGYPIPNGPSNNFSNTHCTLISESHPKFNPSGIEIALPLLILPNK